MPTEPLAFEGSERKLLRSILVPTLLEDHGLRYFFYSNESQEPPHVHVERDNRVAKFWLKPVRLADAGRLSRQDIRRVPSPFRNMSMNWS